MARKTVVLLRCFLKRRSSASPALLHALQQVEERGLDGVDVAMELIDIDSDPRSAREHGVVGSPVLDIRVGAVTKRYHGEKDAAEIQGIIREVLAEVDSSG